MFYCGQKSRKVREPDNTQKAYDYVLFLLNLRLRTVGEVRDKMRGRGYSEETINGVVAQLEKQKYLDDARFAEVYLENLKAYRTFGYYGIKKKMMEKKIPGGLIELLLQNCLSISEEAEIGRRLLAREGFKEKKKSGGEEDAEIKYSSGGDAGDPEQKQKQKLAARLKSKGFRGEVVSRLLF